MITSLDAQGIWVQVDDLSATASGGSPGHRHPAALELQTRAVARDVHDIVGGALTAARLALGQVARAHPEDGSIAAAGDVVARALADVRSLLRRLEEPAFEDGLVAALRRLVASYAQVGAFAGRVRGHPIETRLPATIELAVFRMAQEALTNAARHSGATLVEVEIRQGRRSIELIVTDDGAGFPVGDAWAYPGDRLGLRGMQERAALLGGTVDIRSGSGLGTTVRVAIPVPAAVVDGRRLLESAG